MSQGIICEWLFDFWYQNKNDDAIGVYHCKWCGKIIKKNISEIEQREKLNK